MNTRQIWVETLTRMVDPVLTHMAGDTLKENMPLKPHKDAGQREECGYLEILGRTLCGLSAWFNAEVIEEDEKKLQEYYLDLAIQAVAHGVDEEAKDFVFIKGKNGYTPQILVDTAFLALAFLRAKDSLWDKLPEVTKSNVVKYFKETRSIQPYFNNWILFSGMIETFLCSIGEEWDKMRVDYCYKQMEQWYIGDGIYSDGTRHHEDYYNSYVIQPFLVEMVRELGGKLMTESSHTEKVIQRAQRYAMIQEARINCDGTFNAIGRSITYRCGAFHHLATMAYHELLPEELSPAGVRCALTAMIKKCMEAPSTYDEKGWLNVGLYGHQPNLREFYISQASLYLATFCFLPLGLGTDAPFWALPDELFTMQKIWSGIDVTADHAISI